MNPEPSTHGSTCPRCGTALTTDELAGGCPRCLANALFAPTSPTSSAPASAQVIRCLGDYELFEEIARGGMGIVYRARQVSLNRTVAVKLMRDSVVAGADEVRRFRVALWKFRQLASYHSWLGKTATMALSVGALMAMLGWAHWPLRVGLLLMTAAILEEVAISLLLTEPRSNIPSWWHARKLTVSTRPIGKQPPGKIQA